jgi:hypothetical protein
MVREEPLISLCSLSRNAQGAQGAQPYCRIKLAERQRRICMSMERCYRSVGLAIGGLSRGEPGVRPTHSTFSEFRYSCGLGDFVPKPLGIFRSLPAQEQAWANGMIAERGDIPRPGRTAASPQADAHSSVSDSDFLQIPLRFSPFSQPPRAAIMALTRRMISAAASGVIFLFV